MNHRHRKVLHALFAHPISANIHANDVEAVLSELGAELDHTHRGKLMVRLNGQALAFPHSRCASCAGSSRAAASTPAPTRHDAAFLRRDPARDSSQNVKIEAKIIRQASMRLLLFSGLVIGGLPSPLLAAKPEKLWGSSGFRNPESAVYDGTAGAIYVSNVDGEPTQKDGNGFISKPGPDGTIVALERVKGLDSPTGLALAGGILHAADGKATRLLPLGQGSADLGIVPGESTVLIPMMMDGLLVAYRVD
jgi:hypothetical protein